MTPAQWVAERAEEWAEWRERVRDGGVGHRARSSAMAEYVSSGGGYGKGIDFAFYDEQRCIEFDRAVRTLVDPLRVVFLMHWLGSEELTVDTSVEIKAGRCGLSKRGYYARLEEANLQLYDASR